MKTRQIASLQVSELGLGCMNMSMGYGPAEDDESLELIRSAPDYGVTFLDTATMYGSGHNETLVGKAIAGRRHDFVVASKCGLSSDGIDGRPETLLAQAEASLEKLGVDEIDLYYLHRADPAVPIEESVGALARLVETGKVREIGLSEVSTGTLRRAASEAHIAALQSEYSLWSRTPEAGILGACRELGVAFVPFSPLGRQFLTGKACSVDQLDATDLRSTIARPRFEPDAFSANSALLGPFGKIADRVGCSKAQLALAWLLAQQDSELIPIPGTRSREHLQENAHAAEVNLDASTITQLNALINEDTVTGTRYTADRMAEADSERDRRTSGADV